MPDGNADRQLVESWTDNADAWTQAVRDQLIPSRKAGTDAAIVNACLTLESGPVLDVGCGEGWLVRELGVRGRSATGIDVSAPLIARAQELGGGYFAVATSTHSSAIGAWPRVRGAVSSAIFRCSVIRFIRCCTHCSIGSMRTGDC